MMVATCVFMMVTSEKFQCKCTYFYAHIGCENYFLSLYSLLIQSSNHESIFPSPHGAHHASQGTQEVANPLSCVPSMLAARTSSH